MGPLNGLRIIEMKGIGPGPYAGMLLADMGAEVIMVERAIEQGGIGLPPAQDPSGRGKKSIVINLKTGQGLDTLLALVESADVLIEGYRPGVAERLGFGPDVCMQRNPKLVYGRMTGWGQTGPLAYAAGHDINYISLTGSLAAIGNAERPIPPLNLVGDYAGGSLFLVMGVLAALYERERSGKGQVIDAAITDGSASLMTLFHGMSNLGYWTQSRQSNLLDGAAPYYDTYKTRDGKFVSLGAIEPQFYAQLIEKAGLDPDVFSLQNDVAKWPELKQVLAAVMSSKTRDEWCALLEGSDVCFAPVLDLHEAPQHPHNKARETYIDVAGVTQPAPAPRFSRTTCDKPGAPPVPGADTDAILAACGLDAGAIEALKKAGVVLP